MSTLAITGPKGQKIHAYNSKGQPVCGARRPGKPVGELCQSTMIMENGRCRFHNGNARSGINHPGFKTGKFMALGGKLAERYERMRSRTDLTDLTDNIAVLSALFEVRVQEIEDCWTDDFIKLVAQTADSLQGTLEEAQPDWKVVRAQALRLCSLLRNRRTVWRTVADALSIDDQIRKDTETYTRILERANLMVKMDELNGMMVQLDTIIFEEVADPMTVQRIWSRIRALRATKGPETVTVETSE